jgi:hypothetical protein
MGLSSYNNYGDVVIDNRGVGDITRNANISPGIGVYAPNIETIQGQMLTTSLTMSPYEAEHMDEHEMKTLLVSKMMREIMDSNCIEFTKQQDYASDEVIIRARIFVTPNDDVQLIRKVQK